MAGDIEAFLKLAAERRRQAQGGQVAPSPQPSPPAPRPVSEPERRPLTSSLKPSVHDAEIVDAVLDDAYPTPGSVPQASRPQKAKGKQRPKSSTPIRPTNVPNRPTSVAASTPASYAPADYAPAAIASAGNHREADLALANRVVQMFKNPSAIASAIVLSEILKPLDLDRED